MPTYEWKHRCRECGETGYNCRCGIDYDCVENTPPPEQGVAHCPYCQDGEVGVTKVGCEGEGCGNAFHALTYHKCGHLVYIRCSIERYGPGREPETERPEDNVNGINPAFVLDGCQHELEDFLFDMAHGEEVGDDPACPYMVLPFSTTALAFANCDAGEGHYIALEAEGGVIFAMKPADFLLSMRIRANADTD